MAKEAREPIPPGPEGSGFLGKKTMKIYGIKNCDTIRTARAWLDMAGYVYVFHDYKVAGADPAKLEDWVAALGWETVLNRAGTTFRGLPASDKLQLDARKAVALMVAQPSMIKRPVLERDGDLLVGFKPEAYASAIAKKAGPGG